MDGRCRATKANGERCRGTAAGPHGYCWAHAPENAEKRRRMASRAARGKPSKEIRDLKKQLADLAEGVLDHRVGAGVATIVNQIINTRARLIELERKIREEEALLSRIERLEQSQQANPGGRQWAR